VSWGLAAAFGLLLESLQWLMASGRQWEAGDQLANALGAIFGCVVFCLASGRLSPANVR
jgi:glycopeptide antibiotics resistance protein